VQLRLRNTGEGKKYKSLKENFILKPDKGSVQQEKHRREETNSDT
jgi:hypothetical protein